MISTGTAAAKRLMASNSRRSLKFAMRSATNRSRAATAGWMFLRFQGVDQGLPNPGVVGGIVEHQAGGVVFEEWRFAEFRAEEIVLVRTEGIAAIDGVAVRVPRQQPRPVAEAMYGPPLP